jgi:hypothetical protein
MPLIKTIRHGFEFWEAPRCTNPPLPELERPPTRLRRVMGRMEYRRRQQHDDDKEPTISPVPAVPSEITNIQAAIIDAFGIGNDEFYGRNRTEPVANARIASMALCRAYTSRTVEEIADAHNRHHRVVCHASYRFAELQQTEPAFAAAVTKVECSLLQNPALN